MKIEDVTANANIVRHFGDPAKIHGTKLPAISRQTCNCTENRLDQETSQILRNVIEIGFSRSPPAAVTT